jgi:hypothetical protein
MPSGVDPNLFASLAAAYAGGIRAPSGPEYVGYRTQVDATGTNLEYVSDFAAALAGYDITDESGAVIGRVQAATKRLTTADGATQLATAIALPPGIAFADIRITAKAHGTPTLYTYYAWHGTHVSLTVGTDTVELAASTTPPITSVLGTYYIDASGGFLSIYINPDAYDPELDWTIMTMVVVLL